MVVNLQRMTKAESSIRFTPWDFNGSSITDANSSFSASCAPTCLISLRTFSTSVSKGTRTSNFMIA